MKAFLFSDLHASLRQLNNIQRFWGCHSEIDLAIFAGDLVNAGNPVDFTRAFIRVVAGWQKPLFWVPGNNDFGPSYEVLNQALPSLEGRVVELGGRCFTGVGGSPESWSGQYQGKRGIDANDLAGSIFVTHYPPPGTYHFLKNVTNKRLASRQFWGAPLAHICGHIHHQWGVSNLGQTRVIKLGAAELGRYAILDLDSLEVEFKEF
ncbi:MAG: metallophosphoesterase [Patescibacteria group bacterium]